MGDLLLVLVRHGLRDARSFEVNSDALLVLEVDEGLLGCLSLRGCRVTIVDMASEWLGLRLNLHPSAVSVLVLLRADHFN